MSNSWRAEFLWQGITVLVWNEDPPYNLESLAFLPKCIENWCTKRGMTTLCKYFWHKTHIYVEPRYQRNKKVCKSWAETSETSSKTKYWIDWFETVLRNSRADVLFSPLSYRIKHFVFHLGCTYKEGSVLFFFFFCTRRKMVGAHE